MNRYIGALSLLLFITGCQKRETFSPVPRKYDDFVPNPDAHVLPPPGLPITVFIHGGGKPVSSLVALPGLNSEAPRGLTLARSMGCGNKLGKKIIKYLKHADPQQFPTEAFYIFGWSGILSYEQRLDAGRYMYRMIRFFKENPVYKNTPITIITHSHGGNVALAIAQAAQENNDCRILVDQLIMMAPPVLVNSDELAQLPTFKKMFSFYSKSDPFQVLDPQAIIYPKLRKKRKNCSNIFSQRRFAPTSRVIQSEIKFNNRSLVGHMGFTSKNFLYHLPKILQVLSDPKIRKNLSRDKDSAYCISINTHQGIVERCRLC